MEGGENLVAGADNEIKVICTAEDGTQKVYTIIAKRAAAHGSTEPTEPQTPVEPERTGGIPWWTLLIVGALCLAVGAVGGMFITGKKKG